MKRSLLLALALVAGCKSTSGTSSLRDDEQAAPQGRQAFYDSKKVYWLAIDGWGQGPGFRGDWQRLHTGQIGKNATVPNARLRLIAADPKQVVPNDQNHNCVLPSTAPLIDTQAFRLNSMGNKTKYAAKGNLLVQITDPAKRVAEAEYLHLVALVNDLTYVREGMAYDMIRAAGAPSSYWTWMKLCVDGKYYGLYFVHERSDDAYYKRNFNSPAPLSFYEGAWVGADPADMAWRGEDVASYKDRGYELKGPSNADSYKDLVALLKVVNGVGKNGDAYFASPAYAADLEKVFDAAGFVKWMAAARLLGAWDNYMANANNFFIGNFGTAAAPYFRWIPVDYDNVFGQHFTGGGLPDVDWANAPLYDWEKDALPAGSKRPLAVNLLKNPRYKELYKETLGKLLAGPFTHDVIDQRVKELWETIQASVFAEAKTEKCESGQPAPFHCAHTGRSFANHSVWRWTNLEVAEDGHTPYFQFGFDGGTEMRADGIRHYVKRRAASAKEELAR